MSDTLRPWLADAVSSYQRTHGRNLTFAKKGRLLQITQFNNYRNTHIPAEKEKDVYAWAHDKAYEVLIRIDAEAINAFEENHDSFTSYRFGLFHILEYKFVLGTDYISEEPRSSANVRTFPDLPKPRIFFLHVTKFTYISSKGEGNFASRSVRTLEQITRNWKVDIEEDEEKKRGLAMQVTASQVHTHDAPPRLEDMQAAADSLKQKKQSKSVNGSQQRSPKRQKVSRSLNLNNMLPIPMEMLLSSVPVPKAPGADLIGEELIIQPPVEAEDMDGVVPSTPPPPSSNPTVSTITGSSRDLSAVKAFSHQYTEHSIHASSSPTGDRLAAPELTSVVAADTMEVVVDTGDAETTISCDETAHISVTKVTAALPEATHSDEAALKAAALDDALAAAEAERGTSDIMLGMEEPTNPLVGTVPGFDPTDIYVSTSTPKKKRKKVQKLQRFPLDAEDEDEDGNQSQTPVMIQSSVSPDREHRSAEAIPSKLVDVEFIRDLVSSPIKVDQPTSPQTTAKKTVAADSFYSRSSALFQPQSSPLPGSPPPTDITDAVSNRATQTSKPPLNGVSIVLEKQETHQTFRSRRSSEISSDGFEFVSYHEPSSGSVGVQDIQVKVEERGMSVEGLPYEGIETASMPPAEDAEHIPSGLSDDLSNDSASSSRGNITLQLADFSQQDIDAILSTVKAFTKRRRSSRSSESKEAGRTRRISHSISSAEPIPASQRALTTPQQGQAVSINGRECNTEHMARSVSGPVGLEKQIANRPDPSANSLLHPRRTSDILPKSERSASPAPPLLSRSLLSSSLRASRSSQQSMEARQGIAQRMEGISAMLESRGLTRRQGIDLWYCCSGDFEVACQIADNNLALIHSIQSINSPPPVENGTPGKASISRTKNLYKHCWTFEDDQVVEDPNHQTFKVARKLQEIESRRGKGSVTARRRFLTQDPLARKLVRKVRYPYDEDDS